MVAFAIQVGGGGDVGRGACCSLLAGVQACTRPAWYAVCSGAWLRRPLGCVPPPLALLTQAAGVPRDGRCLFAQSQPQPFHHAPPFPRSMAAGACCLSSPPRWTTRARSGWTRCWQRHRPRWQVRVRVGGSGACRGCWVLAGRVRPAGLFHLSCECAACTSSGTGRCHVSFPPSFDFQVPGTGAAIAWVLRPPNTHAPPPTPPRTPREQVVPPQQGVPRPRLACPLPQGPRPSPPPSPCPRAHPARPQRRWPRPRRVAAQSCRAPTPLVGCCLLELTQRQRAERAAAAPRHRRRVAACLS